MTLRFNPVVIPDAAAYSLKEFNSGVLHIFPNLTADITVTLPSPKKGLSYRFQYGGAAADAQDWIFVTGSASNYFVGGVAWLTDGTPDIEVVYSDGNSNDTLTVLTPEAGTWIELNCDGTVWYLNGMVVSTSGSPTIAD
jgi:hypothetical protein